MKKNMTVTALCLFAACALLFTGCTGRISGEIPDSKRPNETSVAPEDTISKDGQTLSAVDPMTEVTEPGTDPWGLAPLEPTEGVALFPGEGAHTEPGLISKFAFQELRVQNLGANRMKFLISKYMPAPGSLSTLSFVHITNGDSLKAFIQEVDSDVFEGACAPYDADFFSQYDLIVIPRMTNTGSLRHSVELVKDNGELRVSVGVTEPEYSTQVMTSWLLVVPVAKADTQALEIVVGMDNAADLPIPTVGFGKLG